MSKEMGLKKHFFKENYKIIIIISIILSIPTIYGLVYFTGGIKYVYSHTMYIPILIAGIFFGCRYGILTALIAGLILGPLMPLVVETNEAQDLINWIYRLVMFTLVGGISGYFADYLRKILKLNKRISNTTQMYLDVADVMLLVLDINGNINLINKKGCEILEVEEKDVLGKNWFDTFVPKEKIMTLKKIFANAIENDTKLDTNYENVVITSKRAEKLIYWHNVKLFDNDNNIIGILSSAEDITEYRYNENEKKLFQKLLQDIIQHAPSGIQVFDKNMNYIYVSQRYLDVDPNLIGKNHYEVNPNIPHEWKDYHRRAMEGEVTSCEEDPFYNEDGTIDWFRWECRPWYDCDNSIGGIILYTEIINERKKMIEKLVSSEKNLKLAQSIAKTGSWELDLNTRQVWGSEEAFKIYDLDRTCEFLDWNVTQSMVDDKDKENKDNAFNGLLNEHKPYDVVFKVHTGKGAIKYIDSKASLITDSENNPIKVVGTIHDITELKNKEIQLEYQSKHDDLTDLYNRRYYFDQFNQLNRLEYYPLGIMMLDVNGLKIINDAFGHKIGDSALIMLGNVLKEIFEKKDIISRIGGDEFTVLLPNTTSKKLQDYKDKIISIVKTKRVENIELSLAIGYELMKSTTEEIDDIQKLAENQMYSHKTTEGSSVRNRAINAILLTLTDKYKTEKRHSVEVSQLCKKIGIELKLREDEIKELEQAGLFHDIGKISIPDSILNKPSKLTDEEFNIIKSHTEIGYQILRAADEYSDLAIHALHHHERWDGKGYPSGLKGNDIPLFSRIICVVDAYEAITADRPYRKKLSKAYAVTEVIKCSGSQFDPKIAKLFVKKVLQAKWE